MTRRVAFIDGGSRGNPGPAGYGVRVEDDAGRLVTELIGFIGVATNNVAEYRGLIAALDYLAEAGAGAVTIRSDSLLLTQQMRGAYRVRSPDLAPLHARARAIAARIDRVVYEHVPRERNRRADALANRAMDAGPAAAAAGDRQDGSGEGKTEAPGGAGPAAGDGGGRAGALGVETEAPGGAASAAGRDRRPPDARRRPAATGGADRRAGNHPAAGAATPGGASPIAGGGHAAAAAGDASLAATAVTAAAAAAGGGHVIGIGIDIEEVDRVDRLLTRYGDRFISRIFTPGEAGYCRRRRTPAPHLAARFSAKEAAMKALGTGRARGVLWRDVEVVRGGGPPRLVLHGGARRRFDALGGVRTLLSLTHSPRLAIAQVVLIGG